MLILGINENHNGTAALVKDGRVLACAAEERFTGIKNDVGYPKEAVRYVLEAGNVKSDQLDRVMIAGFDQDPLGLKLKRHTRFTIRDYLDEMYEHWRPKLHEGRDSDFWARAQSNPRLNNREGVHYDFDFLSRTDKRQWLEEFRRQRKKVVSDCLNIPAEKVLFADHHACHSYYAYFAAQIDRSIPTAIVVADGWGDGCNAMIALGNGNDVQEVHKTNMCHLGRIYRWMTLLLGMRPNEHEYKMMGLAPYAKDYISNPAYEVFKSTLVVDGIDFRWNNQPADMFFYFKERFDRMGIRFDGIAGGVQRWVEEMLAEWVGNIMRELKVTQLVYSGGVAMNVKANKVLSELSDVQTFFVAPSPGDESLSMGAAFVGCHPTDEIHPLRDAYLGPAPTDADIRQALLEFDANHCFNLIHDPTPAEIAQYLADGKVFARCVGRGEFGARALGNRSILCDPSKWSNVRKINEKIKGRDFWMPFTPSILSYRAKDYLINKKNLRAPFMTIAMDSSPLAREHLVAAVHPYDFTVRPQVVEQDINPEYFALIQAFEKITGIGALLNTSLNLHGKPIVNTPRDALNTFCSSGLDGLILPSLLILKRDAS